MMPKVLLIGERLDSNMKHILRKFTITEFMADDVDNFDSKPDVIQILTLMYLEIDGLPVDLYFTIVDGYRDRDFSMLLLGVNEKTKIIPLSESFVGILNQFGQLFDCYVVNKNQVNGELDFLERYLRLMLGSIFGNQDKMVLRIH